MIPIGGRIPNANILGISAFYHDSAAGLVADGELIAAQEERFTRIRHDHDFPVSASRHCLKEAGISAGQLDYVGFYDKPLLRFDRLLETCLEYGDGEDDERKAKAGKKFEWKLLFGDQHESHAASAFYPSPFEEAAILTIGGVGECATRLSGFRDMCSR